jgi:SAM-dependent methyltransferase
MDTPTSDFYKRYAAHLTIASEARRSAMLPLVERTLSAGANVLDVGAGSGRDVAAMLECGFNAFGVEPNAVMREKALLLRPSLRGRIRPGTLPRLGQPFADQLPVGFDAVICSAVLMHLEGTELPLALESMVDQLRAFASHDGPATAPALLISLPLMDSSRLSNDRDHDGRRFHNHDVVEMRDYLASLGMSFELLISSDAVLASTGTIWNAMVFRRGNGPAI